MEKIVKISKGVFLVKGMNINRQEGFNLYVNGRWHSFNPIIENIENTVENIIRNLCYLGVIE